MYRIVKLSGKIYALEIDSIDDDSENIEQFVTEGTPVILSEDLQDLYEYGIDKDEIEIVSNEE